MIALKPRRGLPSSLPSGERLLWQGAPAWWSVAKHIFHVRGMAGYLGAVLAWNIASGAYDGSLTPGLAGRYVAVSFVPVLLALGYAWLVGRMTVYTITDRRVVLKIGLVLPMSFNLPYARIDSASIVQRSGGSGDISLLLNAGDRLAYLVLWPHARPWRAKRAEPSLRCVPDVNRVGAILAQALTASVAVSAVRTEALPAVRVAA